MRVVNQITYTIGASILVIGAVRHGIPVEYWLGAVFLIGAFYLQLSHPN